MKADRFINNDYKRLLNNIPGLVYRSIIHVDNSRTLVYVSDGCVDLLGISAKKLLSQGRNPLMNYIYEGDFDYVYSVITSAIESRSSYKMTYRLKVLNKGLCWVLDRGGLIYDQDGFPIAVEGLLIDYEDEKLTERQRQQEVISLKNAEKNLGGFGDLIGTSKSMRYVYKCIQMAAENTYPIIILGQTGTGKEVVASEIVKNSSYNSHFVTVNCGAIPKDIMESAFFGHVKGAFTGALSSSIGYIAQADGGTLFLDEVAELSLEMQVKLLRVLETKNYMRVGDTVTRTSDFRLISATNKNLEEEVKANRMREDFYYRIKVLSINIPSLKERSEDIPLLADYLCMKLAGKHASEILPEEFRISLSTYDWPGNVRELRNTIERYLAFGDVSLLQPNALKNQITESKEEDDETLIIRNISLDMPLKNIIKSVEKTVIENRLNYYNGNKTKTARKLDISSQSLYRKLSGEDK